MGSSTWASSAATIVDGRVDRTAQVDDERLVRLAEAVAVDQHDDGLAGLAGGEGQCPRDSLVVAAGGGGAVGGDLRPAALGVSHRIGSGCRVARRGGRRATGSCLGGGVGPALPALPPDLSWAATTDHGPSGESPGSSPAEQRSAADGRPDTRTDRVEDGPGRPPQHLADRPGDVGRAGHEDTAQLIDRVAQGGRGARRSGS